MNYNTKSVSGSQIFRVFHSHVRMTFLTMRTKLFSLSDFGMEDKKEADSYRPGIGWERERKEDVWIGDCRVWTGSGECETGICTEL